MKLNEKQMAMVAASLGTLEACVIRMTSIDEVEELKQIHEAEQSNSLVTQNFYDRLRKDSSDPKLRTDLAALLETYAKRLRGI